MSLDQGVLLFGRHSRIGRAKRGHGSGREGVAGDAVQAVCRYSTV